MTNKEAIQAIKDNYPVGGYYLLREALDMAIELLEKEDKHKWHDLRENPNDLPNENKLYNLLVLMSGKAVYASANWSNIIHNWIYDSQYELKPHSVIAWREIEPFEEGEE